MTQSKTVPPASSISSDEQFDLLETLALRGGALELGPEHMARMAATATHFNFTLDAAQLNRALDDICASHPTGYWMVRLLLGKDGTVQAQAHAMPATPQTVMLQLAPRPLREAHGDFVRHKTTRRAHYDAFTPTTPGVFDTVLWNAEGEVTECTRGNLALLVDGCWLTPAAHCGLLPGIGRAHWLSQGRIEEAVVRVSDLPQVQALAFINSLRGWVPAELVKL